MAEILALVAILPFVLAGWLLIGCAALCAWVADTRGRSPGGWFFIGFLLGPLALIAVGLAGDRDRRH